MSAGEEVSQTSANRLSRAEFIALMGTIFATILWFFVLNRFVAEPDEAGA